MLGVGGRFVGFVHESVDKGSVDEGLPGEDWYEFTYNATTNQLTTKHYDKDGKEQEEETRTQTPPKWKSPGDFNDIRPWISNFRWYGELMEESPLTFGFGGMVTTVFTDTTKVLGFELTGNIYDDSAAGYVAAKRSPPKISFLKTDATYINQATGAPTWSGYDNLVAFGGRNANPTVAYYEDLGSAPIKFQANATHYRFLKAGVVQYAVLKTSISATNDYFVLEVATDGTHKVIILWGVEQYGTYASGVYLDGIWPNLSTLTQGWYIVNVSGTYPYPYPASYTVVASGT